MSWLEGFKQRWGITSNFQVILILIVFAINGSFAAWVGDPLTDFFKLSPETMSGWFYYPTRILLIFIVYQITLPIVGFVFGQFHFFWNFEKKMIGRFSRKKNVESE
jgi:ABC-type multidrug transport system permease subunit